MLQDDALFEYAGPTEATQTFVHKRKVQTQYKRGGELQGHNAQIIEDRRDLQWRQWLLRLNLDIFTICPPSA